MTVVLHIFWDIILICIIFSGKEPLFSLSWDFFFWKLKFFKIVILLLLNVVIVQTHTPIMHFTVFAGCYCFPAAKLDLQISATNEYKSFTRNGKNEVVGCWNPTRRSRSTVRILNKTLMLSYLIYMLELSPWQTFLQGKN